MPSKPQRGKQSVWFPASPGGHVPRPKCGSDHSPGPTGFLLFCWVHKILLFHGDLPGDSSFRALLGGVVKPLESKYIFCECRNYSLAFTPLSAALRPGTCPRPLWTGKRHAGPCTWRAGGAPASTCEVGVSQDLPVLQQGAGLWPGGLPRHLAVLAP